VTLSVALLSYRILAEIRDAEIVIYGFKIGHRRDVSS
jgi:mRNA-degrading endonuclease RelE of RelBE toxin-antitoxin system